MEKWRKLEDIHALLLIREWNNIDRDDAVSVQHLDNQQAWIESRLYYCYHAADQTHIQLVSCIIAAYLCTYTLFADVWGGELIPAYSACQLLRTLQFAEHGECWMGHEDLFVWLLMVGGSFSQPGIIRSEFGVLLHGSNHAGIVPLLSSWYNVQQTLQSFIWSEKLFSACGKTFWEACCIS